MKTSSTERKKNEGLTRPRGHLILDVYVAVWQGLVGGAAKGTSPETAKVTSDDYEKAAAKAYAAGQALAAMKAKVVEACGDGSPKEAKESKEIQTKSKDLMAESAALKARAEKEAAGEAEGGVPPQSLSILFGSQHIRDKA